MRKLFLFMNVSLDGYVEAPGHDISAFHGDFEAFSDADKAAVDTMLFGRKTYEMMNDFWPTEQAAQTAPDVAKFMNETSKLVVSRHDFDPGWSKVTVLNTNPIEELKLFKAQPGKNVIIMGSNTLCVSLMQAGLIDEFQIVVNPVVLGQGTSLFAGLPHKADLTLTDTRKFQNGAIMLTYQPGA